MTIFDTLTSSIILANIYNHHRVKDLFTRRGISLEAHPTLVFPIIDINSASLQLIIADLSKHQVTLFRDHEVRGVGLGNKPGVQVTAFFDSIMGEEEVQWAMNDVHVEGLSFKKGTTQAIVEKVQNLVYGGEGLRLMDPISLLVGRPIY